MNDLLLPQPEPSDESLVARVVRRDVEAFTRLYDRYARVIYTMSAHALGTAAAEDVVQDVFLRLWRKADQFDSAKGPFRVWFMAVARHALLDRLQQRSQQQRLKIAEDIESLLENLPDPAMDLEAEAWQRECGRMVAEALRVLPSEQRRALVMSYFGGLSHSDIALRLSWPLGTVKKRIRLGLQKLRALLAPLAEDVEGVDRSKQSEKEY